MAHVDRALVAELLADESLSYREIARRAQCSDWSVRSIARELADGQSTVSHLQEESLTPGEWGIFAGITLVIFGVLWWASRWFPPPDGEVM
jgi:hypothetical protein